MGDDTEKPGGRRGDVVSLFPDDPPDLLGPAADVPPDISEDISRKKEPVRDLKTYTPPVAFVAPIPDISADIETWRDHAQKSVLATILSPASRIALEEGLTAADLRERRLWWEKVANPMMQPKTAAGGEASGGVRINFIQQTPSPAFEEGPIDVTPKKP